MAVDACDHDPPFNPYFMFATGIDSSCPRVGGRRVDQMAKSGHYRNWQEDIELVRHLGTRYLRYCPPLPMMYVGADRFDWDFADLAFGHIRARDIVPIVDLCRFGAPDWIGDFQNPDFPELFARYARAFAERYPWIQLYTPISEIYVCALFSGLFGWWNEGCTSTRSFVTALKLLCRANILAMQAILEVRPDAIFIQSERAGHYHADSPAVIADAEMMNAMRFVTLDLSYGRRVNSQVYEYLLDNGMTPIEYEEFMSTRLSRHCVLGTDYYNRNERRVRSDGSRGPAGETLGYSEIVRQYHGRYGLPVMHSETNVAEGPTGNEAVDWLWNQWANALRLRNTGVPVVGFTWYSLLDQVDWDTELREDNGTIVPTGLYDLDRQPRAVGRSYAKLIRDWQTVLPAQSVCLIVPVVLPSEYEEPMARRRREWLRRSYPANPHATSPGGQED